MITNTTNANDRAKRIRHGRFTNSAHGMAWNNNKSPKDYSRVADRAAHGSGPR